LNGFDLKIVDFTNILLGYHKPFKDLYACGLVALGTSCMWFNIPFIFHWLFKNIITLPSGYKMIVGNNYGFFS
jgi:hypothetical protein